MQDIVPPEDGKSIRNIPVPDRTLRSKFASKKNKKESDTPVSMNKPRIKTVKDDVPQVDSIQPVSKASKTEAFTADQVAEDDNDVIDARDLNMSSLNKAEDSLQSDKDFVVTGHAAQYRKNKKIKIAIAGFGLIALLFVAVATSSMFSSAEIQIVRHTAERDFSNELLTVSYGNNDSVSQIVTTEIERGTVVTATEEEYVETKASGTIIVYNDHDSNPQKLIQNTRFESPEGNIYRIQDSITVPGQQTVGGEVIPGSVEVQVFADEPGESYNSNLTDFTIPGFAGDEERYKNFYARSKTDLTGGFEGTVKKVSESDLAQATTKLKEEINIAIYEEAEKNIPESFTYFIDLGQISYEDLPQSNANETSVQVNIKGTLKLPIFKAREFEEVVANKFEDEAVTGEKPYIPNLEDLDIEYSGDVILEENGEFNILVNGTTEVYWRLDEQKIKTDLAGQDRDSINDILAEYKTVDAAKAFVKPFWRNSFPSNIDDINIEFIKSI